MWSNASFEDKYFQAFCGAGSDNQRHNSQIIQILHADVDSVHEKTYYIQDSTKGNKMFHAGFTWLADP